jgi:hypothetical protein
LNILLCLWSAVSKGPGGVVGKVCRVGRKLLAYCGDGTDGDGGVAW